MTLSSAEAGNHDHGSFIEGFPFDFEDLNGLGACIQTTAESDEGSFDAYRIELERNITMLGGMESAFRLYEESPFCSMALPSAVRAETASPSDPFELKNIEIERRFYIDDLPILRQLVKARQVPAPTTLLQKIQDNVKAFVALMKADVFFGESGDE